MTNLFKDKKFRAVLLEVGFILLLITSVSIFNNNRDYKEIANEVLSDQVRLSIEYMDNVALELNKLNLDGNYELNIEWPKWISLGILDDEINSVYNSTPGDFEWFDTKVILLGDIENLSKKKSLNKEEREFLLLAQSYLYELVDAYYSIIPRKTTMYDENEFPSDYRKIAKLFGEITDKEVYEDIFDYDTSHDHSENSMLIDNKKVDLAKEKLMDIIEVVYVEEAQIEFTSLNEDKYVFVISISDKENVLRDYNKYEASYNITNSDIEIRSIAQELNNYKSSNEVEDILDKIANEFKAENLVCHFKASSDDGGWEKRYIEFMDGVYNLNNTMRIEVNECGDLYYLEIKSNSNKSSESRVSKEEVLRKINVDNGTLVDIILTVENRNEEYWVYYLINDEIVVFRFNSETGTFIEQRKTEDLYYNRF